ncbi:MAG: hypothetical protein AAGB34_08335 [Planctomycetota bacterium]
MAKLPPMKYLPVRTDQGGKVLLEKEEDVDNREETLLNEVLRDRDVPCPVCRYNLRGLTASACPECGANLKAWVKPDSLRLGLWIVALVGLSGGFGFQATLVIWVAYLIVTEGESLSSYMPELNVAFFSSPAMGIGILLLITLRAHVAKLKLWGRIWIAICAWLVSAIAALVFFSMVS